MLDKTSSIICAFGLASAAPRSPYRHLELCGIAFNQTKYKKPRVRGKGTGAGLLSFPRHGAFGGSAFFKKLGRRNKTEIAKQKSQPCGILPAQLRFWAIPHNSKCRYGERGAADAKPKAQIILDAAKVSAASGGNSEPKQGQRSQSARDFCPRSTMRVPQPDIIEHFDNADAVPQPPERCLSRQAGIVRCCL